jgi:hypothetical protein
VLRNLPYFHIRGEGPRRCNPKCTHWCPDLLRWGLPIHSWNYGIRQWKYSECNLPKIVVAHLTLQFGATVFPSYGAFNLSYGLIYLPGSGILAAYTDPATGELNGQFPNALAMYLWAWFILTVIFTVAAMRSSWVLFLDLFFLDIVLLLLACGYMLNNSSLEMAGSALGFVVAFLSCK